MEGIFPIDSKSRELSIPEVLKYFKEHSGDLNPTYPPMNPKAGEVYLYLIQDGLSESKFTS